MFKALFSGYIICFGLYILFSRQPDYFDGEITTGKILVQPYPQTKYPAVFTEGKNEYRINADYLFRNYKDGEIVQIIFEKSQPEKAAVYSWWGYWISPGELFASILIPVGFWFISYSIISNPTPESLLEEIEGSKKMKQPKYDS